MNKITILNLGLGAVLLSTGACEQLSRSAPKRAQDHHGHDHHGHKHESHTPPSGPEPHAAHDHGQSHPDGLDDQVCEEHELEIQLTRDQRAAIGLELKQASSGTIATELVLRGEVYLNGDTVTHIPPRVPGIITSVKKSVGDRVKKGDLLVTLDSQELAEAKGAFLAATERLELAEQRHDRERQLRDKAISSELEYLEAKEAFAAARIDRAAARYKLQALGISHRAVAKFGEKGAGNLARYSISSPLSGVVVSRHAATGEWVSAEENLFVVADLSTVWIDFKVFKKDLRLVKAATPVDLSAGNDGPETSAKIKFISPTFDTQTRAATARVVLQNPHGLWRPGLFVTARIQTSSIERAVVVPTSAVVNIDEQPTIFVEGAHGFVPTTVATGLRDKDNIEVLRGLAKGRSYVAKGAFELKAKVVTSGLGAHAGHGH